VLSFSLRSPLTEPPSAIIALFRVMNRYVGNLPPMPGVFPDYPAPVVRNEGTERELTMMRWGMPPPPLWRWQRAMRESHRFHFSRSANRQRRVSTRSCPKKGSP
jgi:putative SOS response-associated peptidase YedK